MNSSNYLSEVSDLIIRRRAGALTLSPMDWQLISEWENDGIPLRIALRAINEVFDNYYLLPKSKRKPIKSIAYFQEEIEASFDDWLQTQVGK